MKHHFLITMKHTILAVLLLAAVTMVARCPEPEPKELRFALNDSLIEQEMNELSQQTTVPLCFKSEVTRYISLYVNYRYELTQGVLQRATTVFPIIETTLRQHGLPDELKYFAVVQSTLNPQAVSRQGNKGLWQLSISMAKRYGLTVNDEVDERFDPVLSTEAACKCLAAMYAHYGDWLLAMTAFEMGTAYVDKTITAADGSKDYWTIRQYLPAEVRGYMPAYMAVAYIMTRPERFEFSNK